MASIQGGEELNHLRFLLRKLGIVAGTSAIIDIGTPIASGTPGAVLYVGAGPVLAQDFANFSYSGGVLDMGTGFRIGGAAASGRYLRGNGTNFVSSTIQATDLPASVGSFSRHYSLMGG